MERLLVYHIDVDDVCGDRKRFKKWVELTSAKTPVTNRKAPVASCGESWGMS